MTLTPKRLDALSDGVFAIAMTILVLNIKMPSAERVSPDRLAETLRLLAPQVFVFLITFINLGVLWIGQQNQAHVIARVDRWFLWMNIGFLFMISFLPLATALLEEYPLQQIALILYGVSLIAPTLMLGMIWRYATGQNRLVSTPVAASVLRLAQHRLIATTTAYCLALLLSLLFPLGALVLYLLIPLFGILPGRIDKYLWTANAKVG